MPGTDKSPSNGRVEKRDPRVSNQLDIFRVSFFFFWWQIYMFALWKSARRKQGIWCADIWIKKFDVYTFIQ